MIKTELQSNNLDLRALLDAINNLPEKGSGSGEDISEELAAQDALISEISLALDEVAVAEAEAFAAIGVTYSEGSTCTCSCGNITLTAKNTSGQVLFLVPNAGEWVVTAGDRSEIVSIIEEGQCESLNLASFYIFKSGSGFSEGYSLIGKSYAYPSLWDWAPTITDSYIYNSEGGERGWAIAEPVDLREYKRLKARVLLEEVGLNNGAKLTLAVTSKQFDNVNLSNILASSEIGSEAVGEETVISVDISNINDSFYVSWGMRYTKNYVYDIWLE